MDDRETRNAYLDRVLVGGREKPRIVIADHDPAWTRRFEHERDQLRAALGTHALAIDHIGSTSVPGLAAKPIVDMLLTVAEGPDEALLREPMERAGYLLRVREANHLMFRTPVRDVQVHVLCSGDPEIERYLRFRDRLRSSPDDRAAYERLKRELAAQVWVDVNHYADAKTPFIERVLGGGDG